MSNSMRETRSPIPPPSLVPVRRISRARRHYRPIDEARRDLDSRRVGRERGTSGERGCAAPKPGEDVVERNRVSVVDIEPVKLAIDGVVVEGRERGRRARMRHAACGGASPTRYAWTARPGSAHE